MNIPESAIQKLNAFFGQEARPHEILMDGVWVDTGCLEWSVPTIELPDDGMPPQPSPELTSVMKRIEKQVDETGENFTRKNGTWNIYKYRARLDERMKQEPEYIQKANDEYMAELMAHFKQMQNAVKSALDVFDEAKALIENEPVFLYRDGVEVDGIASDNNLVLAAGVDQFDILRIEKTEAGNYGFLTEDIIRKLKLLDEKFGIDIIGASIGGVMFILKRIPKGPEARELGKWLLEFCPELYEAPKKFPEGKVSLWWD